MPHPREDLKLTKEQKLAQLKLPLEEKIKISQGLILEWYHQYNGNVYVSFSGGKDSTVLLHLVRSLKTCKDVKGVYADTGLEYPEIRDFVKKQENIVWLKPKLTFKQVLEKWGWPIISKEQSKYIYDVRNTKSENMRNIRLNGDHWRISKKWKPLIDSDFKIGSHCCDEMKKKPFKKYDKETGAKAMLGIMAGESKLRMTNYLGTNCNAFNATWPKSTPIAFWTEQDILRYIKNNNIEICSVYGDVVECPDGTLTTTGCDRTGCMFCMYGLHLDSCPNRFERMKETHPKQYDYIMNQLNGKHVMEEYLKCAFKSKLSKIKCFQKHIK
jgi:3'-phosphoadenosine 5'-phosphosulfate sulfotransferase (PAPS reductase)/FAD synthetase